MTGATLKSRVLWKGRVNREIERDSYSTVHWNVSTQGSSIQRPIWISCLHFRITSNTQHSTHTPPQQKHFQISVSGRVFLCVCVCVCVCVRRYDVEVKARYPDGTLVNHVSNHHPWCLLFSWHWIRHKVLSTLLSLSLKFFFLSIYTISTLTLGSDKQPYMQSFPMLSQLVSQSHSLPYHPHPSQSTLGCHVHSLISFFVNITSKLKKTL